MAFWTDKQGNKLTFKEFMARWKKGLEGITPLQQTKTQLTGSYISLLGIVLGLIVCIIAYEKLWWVGIILVGALINTGATTIGVWQKKKQLQNIEDLMNTNTEEDKKKNEGKKEDKK